MTKQKSPDPAKEPNRDKVEHGDGKQRDDNIDDLGRNINDPDKKPLDQPTGKKSSF